ncbi:MAG TPA: FAD-dependent oxidoreductase [Candidatus Dormibacteraeota bacterium]|jgi:3-phenylpropionate/trans-cinnamate dioxygenase ferredoxin reductase subunit|nr:FAD-dependent oxidoreductase [Candidatus Dormibacteraeota bacterium]
MPETTIDGPVVIVGSGLAGGNAAVSLREKGFTGPIILVGRETRVAYGRPPLSKTYLRGEEDLSGWYVKPTDWYDTHDVELRTHVSMQGVETDTKHVRLDDGGSLAYDKLILCTGGRPRTLTVDGADLAGVHVLRTVADCDAIKAAARPGVRAVVVGMGFIGSEVAASLRQMGLAVTAVLTGAFPLQTVLGDEVGSVMRAIHEAHGVELVPEDRVAAFEGSDHLERVVTANGRRIECELAVVGLGIEPDIDAVESTAIALSNGILVDERCRTNIADVYAAGDVANHLHPVFGRVRVEHYNNAEKQGRAAARSVLGSTEAYADIHTFWSDQFEHNLEYVGLARDWDQFVVRGSIEERRFLGFYLKGGVLTAAMGLNRGGDPELDEDSELRACQRLIAERAPLSPATLADEHVDLHSPPGV